MAPSEIFLARSLAPHFLEGYEMLNFEYPAYRKRYIRNSKVRTLLEKWEGGNKRAKYFQGLKILAHGKEVQEMNKILLDCYCSLTYAKCCSSFLCVFWLARKKQLIGNF